MSDSIEAKYQIVPERTLPVIASEIHQIERTVYGVAMDGAIQIGEKLKEAQGMIPAGEWVKWLDENLNYSQRQAYNFMEIASNYGDSNSPYFNLQTSANLSISKALELLRLPDEEVENFTKTHDVENESVRSLKEKIAQLKKEKEEAEARADAASMALYSGDEQELADMQNSVEHLNDKLKEAEDANIELKMSLENKNESIGRITDELQAAKEKLKKEKAKVKELKDAQEEEVKKAIDAAEADIREKAKVDAAAEVHATLGQNAEEINRLEAEVEALEKKLANNSNELLMQFKVYMDELQDTYFKINDLISEQNEIDEEVGTKMAAALQKIIGEWRP